VTNLGDIKILFNNVAVPRVVVTQLAVWNTGNTVVGGKEIVESDPLTIHFEDGALILDAQRVTATQEVNDFRIRVSEHDRSPAFLVIVVVITVLSLAKNAIAPHYPAINKYAEWLFDAVVALGMLIFFCLILFLIGYSLHTRSRATPKSLSR
jgi:hypothetical protein